jgi:hypothetical protein
MSMAVPGPGIRVILFSSRVQERDALGESMYQMVKSLEILLMPSGLIV